MVPRMPWGSFRVIRLGSEQQHVSFWTASPSCTPCITTQWAANVSAFRQGQSMRSGCDTRWISLSPWETGWSSAWGGARSVFHLTHRRQAEGCTAQNSSFCFLLQVEWNHQSLEWKNLKKKKYKRKTRTKIEQIWQW